MHAKRNQEEEVDDSNVSLSEEEIDDNNNNQPITFQGTQMKGTLSDINKCPLLDLLKAPVNNIKSLHRFHFELSQVLKSNDNSMEHVNHINNSKISHMVLPTGNSSSSDKKRVKVIKKTMRTNITSKRRLHRFE